MFYLITLIAIAIFCLVKDYRKNGEISFGVILGIILIGVILLPGIKMSLEEKTAKIDIGAKNIYDLNLKEDLENIKKEFRIKDEVGLYWFELKFASDGEIARISYEFIDDNDKKGIRYYVNYDKTKTDGKYIVEKYKGGDYEYINDIANRNVDRIFDKINFIKKERPVNTYDEYRIAVLGETTYNHQNDRSIFVDKNNNIKELTNEDLPVEGLFIILEGSKKDGFDVNTGAATHGRLGSIDFIFE